MSLPDLTTVTIPVFMWLLEPDRNKFWFEQVTVVLKPFESGAIIHSAQDENGGDVELDPADLEMALTALQLQD